MCDPRSAVGFTVLDHWLGDLGGYAKKHLKARFEAGACLLRPEWQDLFLWAVLVGQPEIASLLWRKTEEPLRMAIYASLFCRKMASGKNEGIEKAELEEQALEYEDWAMALLEEAEEDAFTVLLGLPLACVVERAAPSPSRPFALQVVDFQRLCAPEAPWPTSLSPAQCDPAA